ncbi:hypothetical protein [Micromonospora sp. NPDC023814]|uniref:hypothetical protein n=1 Tax=Micromonospora sp. NPDC023814 TaxID=3154596 RepID=UPI0033F757B3
MLPPAHSLTDFRVSIPAGWRVILDEAETRVADRFARVEPRRTAAAFVEGLLSSVERKTCWSLAERAGHVDPQAM